MAEFILHGLVFNLIILAIVGLGVLMYLLLNWVLVGEESTNGN
jgi:hypothetical protein